MREAIEKLLADAEGGLTVAQLRTALNCSDSRVRRELQQMGRIVTRRGPLVMLVSKTETPEQRGVRLALDLRDVVIEGGGRATMDHSGASWCLMVWTGGIPALEQHIRKLDAEWSSKYTAANVWIAGIHWYQSGPLEGRSPISVGPFWLESAGVRPVEDGCDA